MTTPWTKAGQALLDATYERDMTQAPRHLVLAKERLTDAIRAIEADALPNVEELAAALVLTADGPYRHVGERATAILAALTKQREEAGRG